MDKKNTATRLAAVALLLSSMAANAITLELTAAYAKPGSNPGAPLGITGNALFDYTPGDSLVAQGEWTATAGFGVLIFAVTVDGMVMDISNPSDVNTVTATSFSCVEGFFLWQFGAHGCGNYGAGSNGVLETGPIDYSTLSPVRVLGGDDVSYGAPLSVWDYSNMVMYEYDPVAVPGNTAFILSNRTGGASLGNGFSLTFAYGATVVPVPAAIWLFGSTLGLLGWIRVARQRPA